METVDVLFKIILVGDSGVGKSCFLLQFTSGDFKEEHNVTIGVEFGAKTIVHKDTKIKLQIWDTAGQENFRTITRTFYRNAHAVVLMYDITTKETFEDLTGWIQEIRSNADPNVFIFLVGNMIDLVMEDPNSRQVSEQEAENIVREQECCGFCEASAKTGHNVQYTFSTVTDILYQDWKARDSIQSDNNQHNQTPVVKLSHMTEEQQTKKERKCC